METYQVLIKEEIKQEIDAETQSLTCFTKEEFQQKEGGVAT
jgi:hypothetical protein